VLCDGEAMGAAFFAHEEMRKSIKKKGRSFLIGMP
jgi:hypothetical protein